MTAGYRADNLRAWKQSSAGRTYYYYIGGVPYLETDVSGVAQAVNVFAPDGLVARGLGTTWTSFDFDPQGNVLHRYNGAGTILTTSGNSAYGSFASWGTGTAPWAYNAKWGYYFDAETGFYYCQNRYYDPAFGRWLTRDPIGFNGGMNVYGYGAANPVVRIDPSGLAWHDPVSLKVSPDFDGQVFVVGELGPGKQQVYLPIRPGHSSPPGMDVDIVILKFKDGHQEQYFLPGANPPQDPEDVPSSYSISSCGKVEAGPNVYRELVRGRLPGAPYDISYGVELPVPSAIKFGSGGEWFPKGGRILPGFGSETGNINEDIRRAIRRTLPTR